mgnify:CR=1 FL=1|tara:strand:+ start:212 stop:1507 length:1296 start_codon:yes stop_codon:yes gene_type:complete
MFGQETFINKKILIYGLGISGKSCFKYLYKNNNITVYDDNNFLKNKKNKSFFLNKNKIIKQKFDYIVLSPGIDIKKCKLNKFLFKNIKKIVTELDIFYLIFPKNIKITITGTNGKSTTCQMLYDIFKLNKLDARLVGNIGNPPLLEKKISKKTIFIIEASSYQIFYSKYFKTNHAVILNLTADHLERHGNIEQYAKAKLRLIFNQNKNSYSYIENHNLIINKYISKKKVESKLIKLNYNKENFFKEKIRNKYLLDKNNLNNIHFVYSICKNFRFSDKKIFKTLNKFKGLKYRKQIIYNKSNLIIINDSKSTSFSSTIGLLSTYKNIHWIVGGLFKKGDKFKLDKKYFKNITAYIIGLNKKLFVNQFSNKIKFKYCKNISNAIFQIKREIKKDFGKKTILFSPAAASFDQFNNFEDRGVSFNRSIRRIILNK